MEKWRATGKEPKTLYDLCTMGVPFKRILNLSRNVSPQRGDIIKIVGRKNIFGRVMAYQVEPSDFIYVDPYDEKYRLKALAAGFTDVEEYIKVEEEKWKNEFWQELMEKENLTREEAQTMEPIPDSIDVLLIESKHLGVDFIEHEREWLKRLWESSKGNYCQRFECYKAEYLADEFVES